jgi:hypothetical protein
MSLKMVFIQVNPLRITFMLHWFNRYNWRVGRFKTGPSFDSYSFRFCYNEFDPKTIASVKWNWRTDTHLSLNLWDAFDKTVRRFPWKIPAMQDVMEIRFTLHSRT